jgi:CO/xanthine dehydrogenase Mo-binding subunit
LQGVKAVISYKDIPKINAMHLFLILPSVQYFDSFLLAEKARHVGDRIAAVAATRPEIAEEALSLVQVDYEELPAVFDPIEAMKSSAPVIHDFAKRGEKKIEIRDNVVASLEIEVGDVEKGFRESELVVENEFRTSRPNNAPLERMVITCCPAPGGRLEVYAPAQSIHGLRMNIAYSLGLPPHKINVHRIYLGGAFGGHIHTGFIELICAFLALKIGQPVRAEKTREEMFLAYGRHPFVMKLRSGVKRDGTLMAQYVEMLDETGAYAFSGQSKLTLGAGFFMSMYRCPNMKCVGKTVYTNTPPLTAMRGAGNPQVHFAVESQMDIVAEKLGMDPIALRYKNHLREGDTFYGQGPDIVCKVATCGTEELLKRGAERIGWENRGKLRAGKPWLKRGFGMARGFHTSGAGSPEPSKFMMDYSGAIVKMNEDGTATLLTACVDVGGGNLSAHVAIVAETLGLTIEDVIISQGDTDSTLYDACTHASRSTYAGGLAVKAAAEKVKGVLLHWASNLLEAPPDILEIKDGRVYALENPSASIDIKDLVQTAQYRNWGTAVGEVSLRPTACPPHFTVCFAEVEVDTETGIVRVVRIISGADPGTAINMDNVKGQLVGGFHMGMGYALLEDTLIDRLSGRILNPNFSDYKTFTAVDMPVLDMVVVETFELTGPFGAKGVGEGATNPVAPAIANAIYNAIGVRFKELPITPEKVLKALKENQSSVRKF